MKIVLRGLGVLVLLLVVVCGVFYVNPLWVNDQRIRLGLWQQGVRGGYIEAEGYRVHYFEAKPANNSGTPGAGTPLVLIHGLGSRGEDWAPLIPQLAAAGFHVYVPDLLGFGRSARPDVDYSIATQVKLVEAFLHGNGIEKADVAGWSMGGWVAAQLALDHPELVNRLILFDSVGVYFRPTFEWAVFTPYDAPGLGRLQAILDPHPQKLPQFVVKAAVRRLDDNALVVNRSVSQMISGRDLLDFRLSSISRPTLLVWGSEDALVPLSVGKIMHRLIPGSSLTVIDGCGHLAPAQCWHSSLETTVEFLKAKPAMKDKEQTLPGK